MGATGTVESHSKAVADRVGTRHAGGFELGQYPVCVPVEADGDRLAHAATVSRVVMRACWVARACARSPLVVGGRDVRSPRSIITVERDGLPSSVWCRRAMAMTLPTDEGRERTLTVLVGQEGRSRQQLTRWVVLERSERSGHRARVDDRAGRMVDRWGGVLDRLVSV